MSELNKMMSTNDLPRGMQVRLREYAQETVHVRLAKKRSEVFTQGAQTRGRSDAPCTLRSLLATSRALPRPLL